MRRVLDLHTFLGRVWETLAFSGAVLAAAVALDPDHAASVAWAFAWGAALFGGGMAAFMGLLYAIGLSIEKVRARRGSDRSETRPPTQTKRRRRWTWLLLLTLVVVSAYFTGGAEQMAFLAGYGPGMAAATALLLLIARGSSGSR